MHSTPSLKSFPKVASETVPMFIWLTMTFSRPFKKDRLALPLSAPLSTRWSMVWLMSLALCPQVVSQASQHFRSSEKQATSESINDYQDWLCDTTSDYQDWLCDIINCHSWRTRGRVILFIGRFVQPSLTFPCVKTWMTNYQLQLLNKRSWLQHKKLLDFNYDTVPNINKPPRFYGRKTKCLL